MKNFLENNKKRSLAVAFFASLLISDLVSANVCSSLFTIQNNKEIQTKLFTEKELKSENLYGTRDDGPSVKTNGRMVDKDGIELIRLRRIKKSWYSRYTPVPFNNQGSPKWFPGIFGAKTGYFFGFRSISDKEMTVPTVDSFSQRLEFINRELIKRNKEPIEIKFYETGDKPQTNFQYLTAFYRDSGLPMARRGFYAVHDASYHASAILLSREKIDLTKLRIELLFKFREKIKSQRFLSKEDIRSLEERYLEAEKKITDAVDFGNGNVTFHYWMETQTGGRKSVNSEYGETSFINGYLMKASAKAIMDIAKRDNLTPEASRVIDEFFSENKEQILSLKEKEATPEDIKFVWDRIEDIEKIITESQQAK